MPRLVHLNGPPGIGKSTIARRYVDDHPLAFCLDIDGFRSLIGQWQSHQEESGRLARRMALAMATEHVRAGHDVIVPQFVARPEFVAEMARVAATTRADFFEVVLWDNPESSLTRFEARADDPSWAAHHAVAARMIAGAGGFAAMYDALQSALGEMPGVIRITTTAGDVDSSYRAVVDVLTGGP